MDNSFIRKRPSGRYSAELKVDGLKNRVYLGMFDTAKEAACAHEVAKRDYNEKKEIKVLHGSSGNSKLVVKKMAQKEKKKAHKGYSQMKLGKYAAQISVRGRKVWLGSFDTPGEASRAYKAAKHEYHGPKAMTNCTLNSNVNWTVSKKRSGLKKRTPKRVHIEKPNDLGVEHVVDGVDLRPMSSDCYALEKSSCEETKDRKNVEDDESNITDCTFLNNNGHSNSPTSVDCDELSRVVPQFENFKIVVNGSSVDPELPYEIRRKYFDLCFNRRSILHDRILMSIDAKLAAEIISKTVKISESIRDCKLKACEDNLETWDKTLAGFEMLGMDVVFIRARINRLLGLCWESKEAVVDKKRLGEINVENCRIEGELKVLESKMIELKNVKRRLMEESEVIKGIAEKYEGMFMDEANEPW